MRSATSLTNHQLNIEEIKTLLNFLCNSVTNLQTSNNIQPPQPLIQTLMEPQQHGYPAQQFRRTDCLLPTPQQIDPYWYKTLKPPAFNRPENHRIFHNNNFPQAQFPPQTMQQPPITSYFPNRAYEQHIHTNPATYAQAVQVPPPQTYTNKMHNPPSFTYARQQHALHQQRHPNPIPHTNTFQHRPKHSNTVHYLVPKEAFEVFKLVRAFSNNRHSYRLFLNDLESQNNKSSRQTQRINNIHQMILGQRLLLDDTTHASDLKAMIRNDIENSFHKINNYYENTFLHQDAHLISSIQEFLKPLTLTQIQAIHGPILSHTLISVDKRRLGRNFRSTTRQDIFDILFQRPAPLRSISKIHMNEQQSQSNQMDTNEEPQPNVSLQSSHMQTNTPHTNQTSSRITSRFSSPANSIHNSPNKSITLSSSLTISRNISPNNSAHNSPKKSLSHASSTSSLFSPSKWQQAPTRSPPQQPKHHQNLLCNSISAPTRNVPLLIHTTTPLVTSEPLNIIPSSQPVSPDMYTISTETENVQNSTPSQQSSSAGSVEHKIQSMQAAILQFKHYTTNIHDFIMPNILPLPSSNPFKFKCRDDFSVSLTQHINILTHNISDTILITILCNSTTPIDCINTHTLLQPTPPSQFLTSASRINTFFNCLRSINQPIILELIFMNNPPANVLWHHIYKHTDNKIPVIISTAQETLPSILNSHRAISSSNGHDQSLLTLLDIMNRPHFLKINPHFLSLDNQDTFGD
jgi:hypothetical protein